LSMLFSPDSDYCCNHIYIPYTGFF
jgi:hypothetical protein